MEKEKKDKKSYKTKMKNIIKLMNFQNELEKEKKNKTDGQC